MVLFLKRQFKTSLLGDLIEKLLQYSWDYLRSPATESYTNLLVI
uniref:Uncharacterized protein n=1 Tax=Rhizophora mucronata TaxID=61149 RepID=A0A2P2PE11_RHIMU